MTQKVLMLEHHQPKHNICCWWTTVLYVFIYFLIREDLKFQKNDLLSVAYKRDLQSLGNFLDISWFSKNLNLWAFAKTATIPENCLKLMNLIIEQTALSAAYREHFKLLGLPLEGKAFGCWRPGEGNATKGFSQSLVESLRGGFREGFSGRGQVCLRSYEMNFISFFYPFPSFAHSLWVKLAGSRYVSHYYRTNPSMTAFNFLRQIFAPPQMKVQSCLD